MSRELHVTRGNQMTLSRNFDPAVWYRADWEQRDDWIIGLTDEEIQDIDVWEPTTIVNEESETDDTKADTKADDQ